MSKETLGGRLRVEPNDKNIERVAEAMVEDQEFYPKECAIADAWDALTVSEQVDIYVRLLKKIYRGDPPYDISEDFEELGLHNE